MGSLPAINHNVSNAKIDQYIHYGIQASIDPFEHELTPGYDSTVHSEQ